MAILTHESFGRKQGRTARLRARQAELAVAQALKPEASDRPCGCSPGTVCTKCFGKPAPAKPRPIAREHPEWAYAADCACSVCNEFWTAFKENHDGADPPPKVPAKVECLVCGAGLAAPPGEPLEHNLCAVHASATPDPIVNEAKAATQTIEQITERVVTTFREHNEWYPTGQRYDTTCACDFCLAVRNDPMFPGEPHGAFAPVGVGSVVPATQKQPDADAFIRKQLNANLRGVFT
ncbi:hypothetical protein LCGC14_0322800 [marine sediment metagenome]|uniref:Uncharacterized protein n=1 Tax=marine sediment metagenome TaxID=412755 RepID=A0A0F9W5V4_9ZZZZ